MRRVLAAAGMATADLRVLPDFLVVGGKRCGTTTLQALLAAHPSVVAPHSGKGTHYFDVNHAKGPRWFRAHYPTAAAMRLRRARTGAAVTGEASPYYCFHPAAPARIAAELPDVKLLFVLRDPVERAFSHWTYECRRGTETLGLREALDAEPERLAGEEERLLADPAYVSRAHVQWSYQARGRYAEQLDRLYAQVPRERVLLLRFRDLYDDPRAGIARVHEFLGLRPVPPADVPVLERGGGEAVPSDVRRRLEDHFQASNARLAEEFGVDLG